jgi:quercetin dioxygenase-like cupin family protein
MMKIAIAGALFSLLAAAALGAEKAGAQPSAKHAEFVSASELKWGEPPPGLPKGAQLAVLHGNPGGKGVFVVRLKMPDGYKIMPHWHTQDEQLTVLSGTLVFHVGDSMQAEPHELASGDYHFLPGKSHHGAEAKGDTVVQINGMGPFDIHYLNSADDPRKGAAAAK